MEEKASTFFISPPQSKWRFLVPVLCSAIVYITTRLMYSQFSLGSTTVRNIIKAPLQAGKIKTFDAPLLELYAWTACALIVTIIFVATIFACAVAIRQTLREEVDNSDMILVGILVITGAVALVISLNANKVPLFVAPLRNFYPGYTGTVRIPYTYFMDFLAFWEMLMLVAAFCALCATMGTHTNKQLQILQRTKSATILLYLSTITLAIGVLQFNFLFRLVGNADSLNLPASQVNIHAIGLTLLAGINSSLFLAAIFVPTIIILKSEAYNVAYAGNALVTTEEKQNWLATTGLFGIQQSKFGKFLAIITPVIAGLLGEPIAKAINSLLSN